MNHIHSIEAMLIKSIIEHWIKIHLFEQNDEITRRTLKPMLQGLLKYDITDVAFDTSPDIMDKGGIKVAVSLVNLKGENVKIEFIGSAKKVEINE